MKSTLGTVSLGILAAAALASTAQAAFVITFDADTLRLNSFEPSASMDIVATNTGASPDDLFFFTINLAPTSGSPDISVDPPASVSHFGGFFFGGGGLPAGDSAVIGSFSFTLSGATTATVESPIATDFGGNFFYQATSDLTSVVQNPVSYTVTAVPEPSSSLLIAAFGGVALLGRRRRQ